MVWVTGFEPANSYPFIRAKINPVTKSRLVFTRRLKKEGLEALKWAERGGFGG